MGILIQVYVYRLLLLFLHAKKGSQGSLFSFTVEKTLA